MSKIALSLSSPFLLVIGLTLALVGCDWGRSGREQAARKEQQQQRDEKTRDDFAKATERLKPAIESAGRKLDQAAERAAEEARAAAQGVKEGWTRGTHAPVDLNSASENELTDLPGITWAEARKITQGRPYRDKKELITKGILPDTSYAKIQDQIAVR